MKPDNPSRTRRRMLALLFLISFLLSCGITWWLHTSAAHAAGFYLEKTRYRLFSPYYLPDPDKDGRKDVIGLRIDDKKGMKQAKKFMPELLTPGYIPEGWELEKLEITKTLQGNQHAVFVLINGTETDRNITIEELLETEREDVVFYRDIKEMKLNDRIVYLCTNSVTGLHSVIIYNEELLVTISGWEEEELLTIADRIN